jgi:hypothetical protein
MPSSCPAASMTGPPEEPGNSGAVCSRLPVIRRPRGRGKSVRCRDEPERHPQPAPARVGREHRHPDTRGRAGPRQRRNPAGVDGDDARSPSMSCPATPSAVRSFTKVTATDAAHVVRGSAPVPPEHDARTAPPPPDADHRGAAASASCRMLACISSRIAITATLQLVVTCKLLQLLTCQPATIGAWPNPARLSPRRGAGPSATVDTAVVEACSPGRAGSTISSPRSRYRREYLVRAPRRLNAKAGGPALPERPPRPPTS